MALMWGELRQTVQLTEFARLSGGVHTIATFAVEPYLEPLLTMTTVIATGLLLVALAGLLLLGLQLSVLVRHLRTPAPQPRARPAISVLKPLCGVDDDLWQNLESFAQLSYPDYEVLLGVKDAADPAYPLACAAVRRWPSVMRVVLQRGEPGLNPKVNQLITLGAGARHEILVVSDSNVSVRPEYLGEVAAYLEDPRVGLLTHPIAGAGEQTLGALFDNAHLSGGIAPGTVAANELANFPIVIGKSMALRRADLRALGGFASVKDVLAEDFVLGQRVSAELGKDVAVAHRPITSVSRARSLRGFLDRYIRWGTIQRRSVGPMRYAGLLLLHPLPAAGCALLVSPSAETGSAFMACWLVKGLLEHGAALSMRGAGFALTGFALLPVKDTLLLCAWALGFARNRVEWRGHKLAVLDGTRLVPIPEVRPGRWRTVPSATALLATRLFR